MKKLCLLLVLLAGSITWAGYIDTDGYYVMDEQELAGFNGADGGGAILTMNGADGTISGIQSATNSWWMGFAATNLSVLPADLTGATGWKLEFENTGAGPLSLILVVSTATNGWQQGSGVGVNPGATGTVSVDIAGSDQMQNYFIIASVAPDYDVLTFTATTQPPATDTTITVDGATPIRTIPMTMFGGNLTSWDAAQDGSNATFNNLLIASGRKYLRWPGGSWGDAYLWRDMEYGGNGWIVSYAETLGLLDILSQPGEEVHPTLQPIVNFPGVWYDIQHTHQEAVNEAVGWVSDQSSRTPTAQYWEIGNEVNGPWETGYFPEISGTYYGDYFADFVLGMKAVNPNIKIGAVAEPTHELNPYGWYQGYWTYDTLAAANAKGVVPDFLIIHQYPGTGADASYNPTLLGSDINNIGIYTSNMDSIVSDAIGQQYVGQVRYWMTEWDAGNGDNDKYRRRDAYINAMFHAQYILEMAKYNWQGANAWAQWEYNSSYWPYPVWYVHPLLINYFGRDMVEASSSHPMVRAYASTDANGDMTLFIVNNSPTDSIPADINISGFTAGAGGQEWFIEPAGSIVAGGVNIQDLNNIRINGVMHPDPSTVSSLPPQSFTSGNSFSITLPPSCMLLLKIPSGTGGDTTPPAAPTGLVATAGDGVVSLDWDDNSEPDLADYNVYRGTTSGGPYTQIATDVTASDYVDNTVTNGTTYYYIVTAMDTSNNESDDSNEDSALPEGTPDTDSPTPNPMTWAVLPNATGVSSISMTATTASDSSGVEYYFTCTAGTGHDSGWQDSTEYTDTGLSPDTTYTYTVTARDKSAAQNATAASTAASATTDSVAPEPDMYVNDIAMGSRSAGKNYFGQATIWIKDDTGANVEGATVSVNWSGATSESMSGVTNSNGQVFFESSRVKNGGTYTITVTNVSKSGTNYNPALNVETSDSITAP